MGHIGAGIDLITTDGTIIAGTPLGMYPGAILGTTDGMILGTTLGTVHAIAGVGAGADLGDAPIMVVTATGVVTMEDIIVITTATGMVTMMAADTIDMIAGEMPPALLMAEAQEATTIGVLTMPLMAGL